MPQRYKKILSSQRNEPNFLTFALHILRMNSLLQASLIAASIRTAPPGLAGRSGKPDGGCYGNPEFSPRLKLINIPLWLIFSYIRNRELGFIYHYGIMDELITLRFIKNTL